MAGPTGPTGPAGPETAGGRLGLRTFDIPAEATSLTVTPADLVNQTYPSLTYEALRFTGGDAGTVPRIVLPAPATDDDAYEITIENASDNEILLANDPVTGDTFELTPQQDLEVSLEQEIQDDAQTSSTYRTRVLVTPDGVYRVPGFSGVE